MNSYVLTILALKLALTPASYPKQRPPKNCYVTASHPIVTTKTVYPPVDVETLPTSRFLVFLCPTPSMCALCLCPSLQRYLVAIHTIKNKVELRNKGKKNIISILQHKCILFSSTVHLYSRALEFANFHRSSPCATPHLRCFPKCHRPVCVLQSHR